MTERSKKIARQFKRHLGHADAESIIADTARILRRGESITNDDHITPLENFSKFVDKVDKSYQEYEEKLKLSARNLEISSRELTEAYNNVESLNTNVNAMLDALGQGLLFFDETGVCSSTYSKACLKLLEKDPANKSLADVLNFDDSQRQTFSSWLNIVFNGQTALDFNDMKGLMPSEIINSQEQIVEIDYKPMYAVNHQLKGVLLIATDVTYKRHAEQQLIRKQQEAEKIQTVARNRRGFHSFITDIDNFLTTSQTIEFDNITTEERKTLMRDLHTYKGLGSSFGLNDLAEEIHNIESEINYRPVSAGTELQNGLQRLIKIVEKEKKFGCALFGEDFLSRGAVKTIELSKIDTLIEKVKEKADPTLAQKLIGYIHRHLIGVPAREAFDPFKQEVFRLARQQNKPEPEFIITGGDIQVLPNGYFGFFSALLHLARNIIDHGIETPKEREAMGKPPQGKVQVDFSIDMEEPALYINIQDDGRGINPDRIRQKLEKSGHNTEHMSDKEILNSIFEQGFSLKSDATLTSGRGVGMDVVKNCVDRMNGTIEVSSDWDNHRGTGFLFKFAYKI